MDTSPTISVIIPTFNRAHFVEQAVESVISQSDGACQVIVVDDGSTDDTDLRLARFGQSIEIVKQSNAGPSAARNKGAELASGDFLAFLDSDDFWFPWTLNVYNEIIDGIRSVQIVTSEPVEFTTSSTDIATSRVSTKLSTFRDYFSASESFRFSGAGATLVRRSLFWQVGGFSEELNVGEDLDFVLKCGNSGPYVFLKKPMLVAYRRHPNNIHVDPSLHARGIHALIRQERLCAYPGGSSRQIDRLKIITRYVRSACISSVKSQHRHAGLSLYLKSFIWQARLRRWRFIFGFPILMLTSFFTKLRITK